MKLKKIMIAAWILFFSITLLPLNVKAASSSWKVTTKKQSTVASKTCTASKAAKKTYSETLSNKTTTTTYKKQHYNLYDSYKVQHKTVKVVNEYRKNSKKYERVTYTSWYYVYYGTSHEWKKTYTTQDDKVLSSKAKKTYSVTKTVHRSKKNRKWSQGDLSGLYKTDYTDVVTTKYKKGSSHAVVTTKTTERSMITTVYH